MNPSSFWGLLLLFLLISRPALSQERGLDTSKQRLLLQLSSGFLNVVKENAIDIDSGLILASRRLGVDRKSLLEEGFINKSAPGHIRQLTSTGAYYVFQPGHRRKDFDSAVFYLGAAEKEAMAAGNQEWISHVRCLIGKCCLENNKVTFADATFTKLIETCARTRDTATEAKAWAYWGTYCPFSTNTLDLRIQRLRKALLLYEATNKTEDRIITLANLAYLNYAAGHQAEAKKSVQSSLELQGRIGFPYTHYSNDLIAYFSNVEGNLAATLRYALTAVKSAETLKDSLGLPYFYSRVARLYDNLGKDQDGLEWYQKALTEFERTGGDPSLSRLALNFSSILSRNGKMGEAITLADDIIRRYPPADPIQKRDVAMAFGYAYSQLQQVSLAEKYYLEAERQEKEAQKFRGDINNVYLYYQMGLLYFNDRQYAKSRLYYIKALASPSYKFTPLDEALDVQKNLVIIDSATGNYLLALKHYAEYSKLKDSIYNATESKQTAELRIQYATEKKDKDIQLLTQQGKLQEAELRQTRFTNNMIIAGIIILFLFLVLLYNRYRLKQRSNRKLEIQQEEINQKNNMLEFLLDTKDQLLHDKDHLLEEKEWLLKEIHHRVKNNLQIVISLLNTQSKYLDNEEAIDAIRESRHRMQAMSLIHQKLYKSDNTTTVNMPTYIRELVDYLDASFSTNGQIQFDLNINSIDLDIAQAIPVGLILNEAITNAIKYAFPDGGNGRIKINMAEKDGLITLEIKDNGAGNCLAPNGKSSDSMGMRLMRGLVRQIDGVFTINDEDGLCIQVEFPLEAGPQRVRI